MSGAKRGFELIGEREMAQPPPAPTPEPAEVNKANTAMLLLALRALSQRAVTAISNLFTLALVASAWFLWWFILPDPTPPQLWAVAGYAVFALAIDIVRRRG